MAGRTSRLSLSVLPSRTRPCLTSGACADVRTQPLAWHGGLPISSAEMSDARHLLIGTPGAHARCQALARQHVPRISLTSAVCPSQVTPSRPATACDHTRVHPSPGCSQQAFARQLETARPTPHRREMQPDAGRERPTAALSWWRIARNRTAGHLHPCEHLRDHSRARHGDDDDFGSARNALSLPMTLGRALLLAPRVSISAGERSRERLRT